ncbi:MAG: CBS domain-containing protein [Polyangiales bacterium]
MQITYFLTPKSDVAWLPSGSTMRQAMEKMEVHRYSAVPLVDTDGRYVGTLTEGDLLWQLRRSPHDNWRAEAEHTRVVDLERRVENQAVRVDAEMEQLIPLVTDQNFVPVVDDRGVFMGIVRRKTVLQYCLKHLATSVAG